MISINKLFSSIIVFIALGASVQAQNAAALAVATKTLHGHVPEVAQHLTALGRLSATNELRLALGVPLRDPAGLQQFLADIYNPASANYHHYLTPDELTARFGPTEADYAAVKDFARTNGFVITAEHGNRLLLDVRSRADHVETAFHFKLQKFQHPTEAREFFAPDAEPTVDAALPLADIEGLSDYARPRPRFRKGAAAANAIARQGSAPDSSGDIFGNDFRTAYAAGTTNTGAGQIVGLLQFDGYYAKDITAYATAAGGGRTNIVLQTVLLDGYNGVPTTGANSGNGEVALDIEMSMAMAPGLAKIVLFEAGPNGLQNDILNSMLTFSNSIKQLSCSWGWGGGPSTTTDNIFQLMAGAGQSFFNASGDSDAFVAGSNNDVDNTSQYNAPSSCPYITQVGGTTLTMNGTAASFASETVWNDRTVNPNGGNWGSSGGISTYYPIPAWQAAVSMASNGGSATKRNIPDVALTANNVYSTYDNGSAGSTGGTSCAAPLWAGFMALVNQQAAINGGAPAGFINPAVYAIATGANYTNCFHDTTAGDNSWSSSASKFAAMAGYDLATGLGTPNGVNLINALAPSATAPTITTSPQSQTNSYGATTTFSVIVNGAAPLAYQWYFTNAIPGATNSALVLTNLTAASAGSYFVTVTNPLGSATSAVAMLAVTLTPAITQSPVSQNVLIGQPVNFTVTAFGAPTLAYQWRKNSNSLAGANGTNYSIASVAAGDAGNYDVIVTNLSGSVTSSVAVLGAVNPASYSGVLAGWETSGLSSYGPSPFTATSNAPNVSVVGLTRGSGVGLSGSAGANAWGGTGFSFTSEAAATNGNTYATFSLTAGAGYTVSCTNIPAYNIRHSGTGSTTGIWQYQVGGGAFTDIGTAITWGAVTSSTGNLQPAIDLSGIAALQNVPAGTTITFRIVPWGGTGTGSWYVNNMASGLDLQVLGSLSPVSGGVTAPVITVPPVGTNVFAGKNAGFSVTATGSGTLNYQWLRNGFAVADRGAFSGSQTSAINFLPAATNFNGSYAVIVTNLGGSVTSSAALLNVVPLPVLVFTNAANGLVLAADGGAVSNSYVIQRATNLVPPVIWLPLQTNVIGASGQIRFTETNKTNAAGFYRIQIP